MGLDSVVLVFWLLSFKPTFSLSAFSLIKRLFSSSSLSATRMVSSAYLKLLIFLPAILIPACDSSSVTKDKPYICVVMTRGGMFLVPRGELSALGWPVETLLYTQFGNSMVIQWLGLSAFTSMALFQLLGTKIPQALWRGQKNNPNNQTKNITPHFLKAVICLQYVFIKKANVPGHIMFYLYIPRT